MSWLVAWLERGWPVALCTLLLGVAYLQARGVSRLIGAALAEPPTTVGRGGPVPRWTQDRPSAEPILRRNPFDSITGPLDGSEVPAPAPSPSGPPPAQADPLAAPKCDFGHVTMILATEPNDGLVAIKTRDGKSQLCQLGHTVGEHQLVSIGWDRVWLNGTGERCQMRLGDEIKVKKPRKKRKKRRGRKRRSSRLPKAIASKIERVSATEYRVDRSAIDAILEQQAQLMRGARIRPVKQGDQVTGMRIARVSRGSLMQTVGIRRGDVIQSINGFSLTDPQKALEAYGRLRTADHLALQLMRGGKPVTIDFHIQ